MNVFSGLRPTAALAQLKQMFSSHGIIEDVASDARLFLEYVLKSSLSHILMEDETPLSESQGALLHACLLRRLQGEPVQYITGIAYFGGLPFQVDSRVLIPRRDSETLISAAVDLLPERAHLLDLCCGSGCIGIVLALKSYQVSASDISNDVLFVAKKNAQLHGANICYTEGDLFAPHQGKKFDGIVVNPPYVEEDAQLMREVVAYEPPSALFAGMDGLNMIRRIVAEGQRYLGKDGWLILEHGYQQGPMIQVMLHQHGYEDIRGYQDMEHRDRVIAARRMKCWKSY